MVCRCTPHFFPFFILTVSGINQRSHKNEISQELSYQVNFPWPEQVQTVSSNITLSRVHLVFEFFTCSLIE